LTASDREKWDSIYASRRSPGIGSDWLTENLARLPRGGKGLDLAAGDGASSLLMAGRGNRMTAVDVSSVGLELGRRSAGPASIEWVVADLDEWAPPANDFDFVICLNFFDRRRLPKIISNSLRPGGLFLGEAARRDQHGRPAGRVTDPNYLIDLGEWGRLFPDYRLLQADDRGPTSRVLLERPSTSTRPAS
jgi:SAM-dependent methyltransferase